MDDQPVSSGPLKADYTDGQAYAMTLGVFIQILVDSATKDAVIFRVVKDEKPDSRGQFCRLLEVLLVPEGQVQAALDLNQPAGVHKVLIAALERGLIS